MRRGSFPGGVHPPHQKQFSAQSPVRVAAEPKLVVIPLLQHLGAPCDALVQKGDTVDVGQKIGDTTAFVAAPVHASISGQVVAVEPRPHPALGKPVMSVVIENDGEGRVHPGLEPRAALDDLDPSAIVKTIREAGLCGLGGAAFPTAVKVSPPEGKTIDTFVLNGAECEPYLTADHRLMVENAGDVVFGMRALMKAAGVEKGIICIEDNKPDAVRSMRDAVAGQPGLEVVALHTIYPQGSEKQMIKSVLGREVPPPPGLPLDVGVIVNNVGTAYALAVAMKTGMPLVERVVTVTGSVIAEPANLRVKIGTLFTDLIEQCGGFKAPPGKLIMGGPMMGIAQYTADVPVIKGASGILALGENEAWHGEPTPCIKCARCVDACPMRLVPVLVSAYAERGLYDRADAMHAADCLECGCCSYVCPARRPLVQAIRMAKQHILAERRKRAVAR